MIVQTPLAQIEKRLREVELLWGEAMERENALTKTNPALSLFSTKRRREKYEKDIKYFKDTIQVIREYREWLLKEKERIKNQ